jgi:hypothetical protein
MRRLITICLVCVGMLLISSAPAIGISINPTDASGIRIIGSMGPLMLSFLDVKKNSQLDDRVVIEFDVSRLSGTFPVVTLDVGIENIDPGLPDGIINIFTFTGDGVVTANDFYAGGPSPFTSVKVGDVRGLVSFDVTSAVQTAVTAGDQFIGFKLSTNTTDRYSFGSSIGLSGPMLTVTPEPATLLLLGLGAAIIRKKQK